MIIFFGQAGPRNAYSRGRPWWSIPLRLGVAAHLNSYRRIRAVSEVCAGGLEFALREKANLINGGFWLLAGV